jgi:low affinity Fe/Cu permease
MTTTEHSLFGIEHQQKQEGRRLKQGDAQD